MLPPLNYRLRRFKNQIIILFTSYGLLVTACFAQSPKYIRVLVLQDTSSLALSINGFYEIIDPEMQKFLYQGKHLKTTVTVHKDGIWIGTKFFNTGKLKILLRDTQGEVSLNGRKFKGSIQFIKKDNLQIWAINYIDLEDYIKGILYHEASHYWPQDVLKAQAIICRTYAAYQMQENVFKDYDVTSDIYSQVYGGSTSERYRTNKAVDETKGEVLTYQNKIFPTYYHATCGGHTEDASLLWSIDILPLKGVPCNFCQGSPHFRWHNVLSQSQIEEALVKSGFANFGNIKDIVILARDTTGRITDLEILTDKKDIKICAKDFRNIVGPNVIRSTNFTVSVVNHDVVFEGYGWGHGVGLCQWGAYFMARQGYKYDQILKYYYPGAKVSLIVNH